MLAKTKNVAKFQCKWLKLTRYISVDVVKAPEEMVPKNLLSISSDNDGSGKDDVSAKYGEVSMAHDSAKINSLKVKSRGPTYLSNHQMVLM